VDSSVRIERIVSRGHHSQVGFWYDQDETEWVLLVAGSAGLQFADESEPIELTPGDFLEIPPHRRHRVAWTDPDQETVWLAIFHRGPGNRTTPSADHRGDR
jgi:cupin 2 domain-containing protein